MLKERYHIVTVVGARPQFIKAAALSRAIACNDRLHEVIVHSGQHYDHNLSGSFFQELEIPAPKYNLGIGSASHNQQMATFIAAFDEILTIENPDLVIVYGDTNTTSAAAIATAKRNIPLAHVEAGLREWNKKIPEEVNKLLTDAVTDIFFCPTQTAVNNLAKVGTVNNVHLTGDISLDLLHSSSATYATKSALQEKYGLEGDYIFMTCHRDRNTDIKENLDSILRAVADLECQVILPLHPRTANAIDTYGYQSRIGDNIIITEPLGFWTTQSLLKYASLAITDSGGIIKEAYFHRVPTVIIDQQTEWIEAVDEGWATVVGPDYEQIKKAVDSTAIPDIHTNALGDGKCGERIVSTLLSYLDQIA